ncbi:MAG: hypothetical protein LQ348_001322 [Seirophora lacunosa]|nr:MAG: hypothetical protein LQ348_001322 [Seirophora lacunosa]
MATPPRDEPLLGSAGDASQKDDQGLQFNAVIGTAVIAQVGIWVLLNSAGVLLTTQAILLLQPTHTPKQKKQGTNLHAVFNLTSILTLIAALVVIEYNKISHSGDHFKSPHAILGLITYILFFLQAIVGIAQYYIPALFGGVDNAKKVYKYHRMSGYLILLMSFITIAAATQTSTNKNSLHIQLWIVIVASVATLVGIVPRIKKQKLGLD